MPVVENNLLTRLTIIAVALTIGGTTIAWLDGRHASASDVSELRTSIEKERLDRIEFEIEAIERRQRNITRMPTDQQDDPDVQTRYRELDSRKSRYLRKREELLLEIGEM